MKPPTVAQAAVAVTTYEVEKRQEKASAKNKTAAKELILNWLAGRDQAKLPDGRVVSRTDTAYDAATIQRGAYIAVSLTVQHPLPPAR